MKKKFIHLAYIIVRSMGMFSLPLLRKIRNFVYNKRFTTKGINVDSFVRITPSHYSPTNAISLGKNIAIGRNVTLDYGGGLTVKDNVTFSDACRIYTHNHPVLEGPVDWRVNEYEFLPLKIEEYVWIGSGAVILHRVSNIGRGAIIASNAVVTKDVPENAIMAGNPAKILTYRNTTD